MSSSSFRLGSAWLTLFVIGTDLFVVSPLLPRIAADLQVLPSSAGWCVTMFSLSYMLTAPLLGHLADRFGRRRLLLLALGAFAVANLLSALAGSLAALLAARTLAGVAAAGITPSIYALIADGAQPAQRATWLSVAVSGLLLSLSIGAPIGTLIGNRFGWPSVFLGISGASLLLLPLNLAIWPRAAAADGNAGGGAGGGLWAMAPRLLPTAVWSSALYATYTYLGVGLADRGYAADRIAGAVLCYGAGALVGTLAGGRLADRFGTRRVCLFSLLGLGCMLFALGPALRAGLPIELMLAVLSVLAQLFFPAQQAGLARDFAPRRATAMAWNNSALFLGIGTGSLIGGEILTRAGFLAVVAASATIAIAGVAVVRLVQPRPALAGTALSG